MAADVFELLLEADALRRALDEIGHDRRARMAALIGKEWAKADDLQQAIRESTNAFDEAEAQVIEFFDGSREADAVEQWWTAKPEHADPAIRELRAAEMGTDPELAGELDQ